jgi:thiamine monophosphate synthase
LGKPASGVLLRKTKTKNSILRLKSAGVFLQTLSQRASQQPLFLIGGVYLKKSEPILLKGSFFVDATSLVTSAKKIF